MLTDTGLVLALIDRKRSVHNACWKAYESAEFPLVTAWPCFSEAMHILGCLGGWRSQSLLWGFMEERGLVLHVSSAGKIERIRELMEKYKDRPRCIRLFHPCLTGQMALSAYAVPAGVSQDSECPKAHCRDQE